MRPLPGDLFTLLVKDCQLPLEHLGVPRGRVPNRGEAYDQRGMRSQARSWEYVTVSDGYGDRVNRVQDRRMGPGRHGLSLLIGFDDHPDLQGLAAVQMTPRVSITGEMAIFGAATQSELIRKCSSTGAP